MLIFLTQSSCQRLHHPPLHSRILLENIYRSTQFPRTIGHRDAECPRFMAIVHMILGCGLWSIRGSLNYAPRNYGENIFVVFLKNITTQRCYPIQTLTKHLWLGLSAMQYFWKRIEIYNIHTYNIISRSMITTVWFSLYYFGSVNYVVS